MVIFGPKTIAIFDVWSLEHFVTGINLFSYSVRFHKRMQPQRVDMLSVFGWIMAVCFAWEALEHYLELGLAGARVEDWFQGVEFYLNRLVSDPMMIVLGALAASKHRRIDLPAKIFSCIWVVVYIFLFPDSMYLQRLLPIISI